MVAASEQPQRPSWLRRVFSVANLGALAVTIATFWIGAMIRDTYLALAVWAIVAGAAGGVAWFLLDRFTSRGSLGEALAGLPYLGAIPVDDSGPAPTLGNGHSATSYQSLLHQIEGQTTGNVLLVSSPGPGQGASSVAMNLSVAAAQAGRRVMLVDADPSTGGIGQFLSSGSSPGLSDVAAGSATLAEASRMWTLDDGTQFPVLPSGDTITDASDLSGMLVADAFDVVSEHADFIVIDVPPVMWSDATPELGSHADGTILVLADSADPAAVTTAVRQLEEANAPVVGYVRNRSTGAAPLAPHRVRSAIRRAGMLAVLVVLGYALYTGVQLAWSWNQVETQELDTSAVEQLIEDGPVEVAAGEENLELDDDEEPPSPPPPSSPTEAYETMLIIGSDEIAGAADVILYLVRPTNGADPFMVSLPRDLYVENPCTGGNSRINTLIKGCAREDINGPTLLAYQVGQITGIEVDHFASFDFEGFVSVVDAVGGVEICHEYPVRDEKAQLNMDAGCTQATGEQALSWVRSRKTQQLVNGSWKSVPGASDLQRNQHQQDVMLQLFGKLKAFDSVGQLTTKAASLSDTFVLDDGLSITEAVELAWGLRSIDLADINRLEIPVRLTRSTSGQSILVATISFDEVLLAEYGNSLPAEDGASGETTAAGL